MKILADQNIRTQTVDFLRHLGHDAVSTRELGLQRASDREIAAVAARDERIIVTFNGDYGSILDFPPGHYPGVIRLRVQPQTEEYCIPCSKNCFLLLHQISSTELLSSLKTRR